MLSHLVTLTLLVTCHIGVLDAGCSTRTQTLQAMCGLDNLESSLNAIADQVTSQASCPEASALAALEQRIGDIETSLETLINLQSTEAYTGCASNPCLNNGTCAEGDNKYTCECADGYYGDHCETDYDECHSNPCKNGGTCTDGVNSYTCQCASDYFGAGCLGEDKNLALHRPAYTPNDGNNVRSQCVAARATDGDTAAWSLEQGTCAYLGSSFGYRWLVIDLGACYEVTKVRLSGAHFSSHSTNTGDFTIGLSDEFDLSTFDASTAKFCLFSTERIGSNVRNKDYVCDQPTTGRYVSWSNTITTDVAAICEVQVVGSPCGGATCDDIECQNGGSCVNDTDGSPCVCPDGYYGSLCERSVQQSLTVEAKIDTFMAAFTEYNQRLPDECISYPCQNGGKCVDYAGYFLCECLPGFSGVTCEEDIDECASTPCLNGATCTEMVNSYQCTCPASFLGPNCNVAPYSNCKELKDQGGVTQDGVYELSVNGSAKKVYCDMTGGGWTVIQRRVDGSQTFYLLWDDYKEGFGDLEANFWLGNDAIHWITSQGTFEIRFELTNVADAFAYAEYQDFSIEDEANNYRLYVTPGSYTGDAGDSFDVTEHMGMDFSTFDNDNDGKHDGEIAMYYKGGWWWNDYHPKSTLNSIYDTTYYAEAIRWETFTDGTNGLKKTEIKIRPV